MQYYIILILAGAGTNLFIQFHTKFLAKNIMFILFNGEAYDYIGSSRLVYDMQNGNFPNDDINLNLDHIGLFVELSQIHYDKEVFFHHSTKNNVYNYYVYNTIETKKCVYLKITNCYVILDK